MDKQEQMRAYYSDVPISEPVFYSQFELVPMLGFSWTQKNGLVVQDLTSGGTSEDL